MKNHEIAGAGYYRIDEVNPRSNVKFIKEPGNQRGGQLSFLEKLTLKCNEIKSDLKTAVTHLGNEEPAENPPLLRIKVFIKKD